MNKEKHLELIQNIVTRMAQNSFAYKGWMLTIFAGMTFLPEIYDLEIYYVIIFPIVCFWGLDAYYLRQERLFCALYDDVRTSDKINFSMDTSVFRKKVPSWFVTIFTKSIFWLYFPAILILLTFIFVNYL